MSVTLRERKTRKGKSLYLDYYKDGTRYSETLGLLIYHPPKNKSERIHNKETRDLAESIRAKRILEIKNGQHGFVNDSLSNASFLNYFKKLMSERKASINNYGNWDSAYKHLLKFTNGRDISFKEINRDLVMSIRNYFQTKALTKSYQLLSKNSQHSYFNKVKAALRQANEDGLLPVNYSSQVKGIPPEDPNREYLTQDEVRLLYQTDCELEVLKKAFLFGCITGLRHSDIIKLVWSDLRIENGNPSIKFIQKKTNQLEYHPISFQALELLGKEGSDCERIFKGLKYSAWVNLKLREWVMNAGIRKKITFHCARHTYAYLALDSDTDIYTLSKLMGHRDPKTTRVYTKTLNHKKIEAAHKIGF